MFSDSAAGVLFCVLYFYVAICGLGNACFASGFAIGYGNMSIRCIGGEIMVSWLANNGAGYAAIGGFQINILAI